MTPYAFDLSAPRQTTNNRNPDRVKLFSGLRTPTNHARHINVIGQAQGQADAHRRDSIKRGGI